MLARDRRGKHSCKSVKDTEPPRVGWQLPQYLLQGRFSSLTLLEAKRREGECLTISNDSKRCRTITPTQMDKQNQQTLNLQ